MAKVITGGVAYESTLTANTNSDIVNISKGLGVGIDMKFTDGNSLLGNAYVDVCNDIDPAAPNWQAVTLSSGNADIEVAGANSYAINLTSLAFKFLRVRYVHTSGDGSARIVAHVKDK
jgi:hypothetical protein